MPQPTPPRQGGRRQHFLPQFMLRGFASRRDREKAFVVCFRRGRSPRELVTSNVGVAQMFYGDRETEYRLQEFETGLARTVYVLRRDGATAIPADEVAMLVGHLFARSQHLRDGWSALGDEVLDMAENRLPQMVRDGLQDRGRVRGYLAEFLRVPEERVPAWMVERMCHAAREFDVFADVGAFMEGVRRKLDFGVITAKAQNKLLASPPDHARHWAEHLADVRWSVEEVDAAPLILGDAAVVAFDENDPLPHVLFGRSEPLRGLCLPISTTRVLVGHRAGPPISVDPAEINAASAGLARQFFVSSSFESSIYARLLGTNCSLISAAELATIKAAPLS